MKAKVIKVFRDKHTNLLHEIDEVLEITNKRFEEINSTSYGVFLEEVEEAPLKEDSVKEDSYTLVGIDLSNEKDMTVINGEVVETNEDDGKIDYITFTKMKKEEIIEYAKEVMNLELNMDMTKAEMIELLEK